MGNAESNAGAGQEIVLPPGLLQQRVIDPAAYWDELLSAVENNDFETIQIIASTEEGKALLNEEIPEHFETPEPLLLWKAAGTGNLALCKFLVSLGADPNKKGSYGGVAVHAACGHNNVDVAEYFVDLCGLEATDESGDTPLVRAASCGCTKVFDMLVSRGANARVMPTNNCSPLMMASQRGDSATVERLLKHGVDVDHEDKSGRTALFYAARGGFLGPMKLLVEMGKANVNHRDKYGNDASWMAESRGMYECVMYLFRHGAETHAPVKSRGFGSEVQFQRLLLRGDYPTARSAPMATASLRGGKRIVIIGGHGIMRGKPQPNNLASLDDADTTTGPNKDLYYADIDEIEQEFPFVADQMAEWRRRIHPTSSAGKWSRHRKNHHIHVDEDGLTAEFRGEMDPACIQADFGFDCKPDTPFIYWELQILGLGEGSAITIGFAHGKYDIESHPGWNAHSFALHGDDGQVFFTTGSGTIWGPRFALGDVVGCGINPSTQEVWYTHNGKFLGVAHHHADDILKQRWYPTMGMTCDGDKAKANFGAYPFMFTFDAPVLRFVYPTLKYPPKPPIEGEEPVLQDAEGEAEDLTHHLRSFSYGDLFHLDGPDGSKLLLICRDSSNWLYQFFTIDTNDWTVTKAPLSSADIATPRAVSYFDESAQRLYYVGQTITDNESEKFELRFNYLNCKDQPWEVTDSPIMTLRYTREMLNYEPNSAPHIIQYLNGYLYVWHPLGTHAIRAKLDFAGEEPYPIPVWEDVSFLGPVSRTTHYTVHQSSTPDTLFVFAGWDDSSQSNSFHIIQLIDIPTGRRDDDGKIITEPALKWSRPHRSGSVPRPRNDTAMIPLDSKHLFIFGGWNGRNYIDDAELVTVLDSRQKDPLLSLLEDEELQRLASDVTIEFKDGKSIKCSKIILHSRAAYFRDLLDKDPSTQSIDLRTVPFDLFYPLLYYLHADIVDSESIEAGSMHMFLDGIVQRFADEHTTRIFQELFAAEVIAQSTLGSNLEQFAWNNDAFSDIAFRIPADNEAGHVMFPAHRSIVCARCPYFRAMMLGGLKESRQNIIDLPDTTPDLFEALLRFIYCKTVDFEVVSGFIVELLLLSSQFDVSELKSLLEGVIAQSLSVDNVISLVFAADSIAATRLKDSCIKFIISNLDQLASNPEFESEKDRLRALEGLASVL
eukprot:TRINITY_DN11762_c0_g1_i1.p1 TRINITY_DN11762_c0_g1~~TRINITY_DN11762_c0_g1_i1.p1  ORF type:complete len:1169 (-),score=194.70 TRINITY_DN11762_c0_g1_i1:108-3614(-)